MPKGQLEVGQVGSFGLFRVDDSLWSSLGITGIFLCLLELRVILRDPGSHSFDLARRRFCAIQVPVVLGLLSLPLMSIQCSGSDSRSCVC